MDDEIEIKEDLTPPILLNINIDGYKFQICCGKGNQTIKWLGLYGSTIYTEMKSKNNSKGNIKKLSLIKDKGVSHQVFIPENVCFDIEPYNIIHPDLKIKDVFPNGGNARINLTRENHLNQFGEPVYSLWRRIAFNVSSNLKQELPDISSLDRKERILFRDFDRLSYSNNPIQTPQEIALAIQQDFKRIHVEDIIQSYDNLKIITNSFLNNFTELNKLFNLYSIPNNYINEKYIKYIIARLEGTLSDNKLKDIRNKEMQYIDNRYTRYEFFELIIRIFYYENKDFGEEYIIVDEMNKSISTLVKEIKRIFSSTSLNALVSNVFIYIFIRE